MFRKIETRRENTIRYYTLKIPTIESVAREFGITEKTVIESMQRYVKGSDKVKETIISTATQRDLKQFDGWLEEDTKNIFEFMHKQEA